MRKRILAVCVLALMAGLAAYGQSMTMPARGDDSDRPSKNGRTAGTIDGVDIVVTYGRPVAKGRVLWGGLVGFGSVWRAGANEATAISFSKDVTINELPLPAGVYGFFAIPNQEEWTLIFNKQPDQWGHFDYDQTMDALRVQAVPAETEHVETLEYVIEGSEVKLRWGKLSVGFTVAAAE